MGILDLFSKEKSRARNAGRVINKYTQSPDRLKAMQTLLGDGSPEALFAVMRRFGMLYDKTIDDEQEKEYLFDSLVEKGGVVLQPLKKYLLAAESISWPLRVLDKVVATKDEVVDVLAEVMKRHEPGYERDPTKKMQLLTHLAGIKSPRVPALVAPYLADMDMGVRYAAAEALLKQGDEEAAREPLLGIFVSAAEESLRLRIRIAEGFAELGWGLGDKRAEVEKRLPEAFTIEARGKEPARIKKKAGKE
ncbi:MAG TPA: HEAT repeat domain-containing protein [Polyangia bacterium]